MLGRLGVVGGVVALAGVAMGYQAAEIKLNYTLVSARIISADQECFIKNAQGDTVVEIENDELAYFPCSQAPAVAAEHNFDSDAIHTRTKFKYQYYSPADGAVYPGELERTDAAADMVPGRIISVYAHDKNPAESRTTKSNFFLDDTGV